MSAPSTPSAPSPPSPPTQQQQPQRSVAEAVQLVLRSETLGSLSLLHRGAPLSHLPLSQLLLLQSVRAAVERDSEGAVPPSPAAALSLLLCALSSEVFDASRLLLPAPLSLAAADWPASLRVVRVPATGAAHEVELSLSDADSALAPLAHALSASQLVFSRPLGPRPKPGRPRGEPRLYFDASATARNAAASWLAGCDVCGDALLAHVALPPRHWGSTPPPAPPALAFSDVTLSALRQLADASLTALSLSEMCARLPGPPPRVEARELPSEECPAEPVTVELATPPSALLSAALHSLARLPTPPPSWQGAGWRATATPPPALACVGSRQATAPTRAAAEQAASLLLLQDLRDYGCAQLGRECAEHPAPPPPSSAIPPRLFSPPLADQRRMFVAALLRAAATTSLLDAGCGRGALLLSLAQEQHGASPPLELTVGVDLSESGLAEAKKVLASCVPTRLSLWAGSLHEARAAWGDRTFDAVTCIEVLEHLPDEESAARAGASLLAVARRLAVFTTPNAEANVLMEAATAGITHVPAGARSSGAFRDVDHKFEWTRAQLRDWALAAAAASGGNWEVSLLTLGALRSAVRPEGPQVGCSQAAVFWRADGGCVEGGSSADVREGTNLRLFSEW